MKKVIITPFDVILFRSSRPFSKGENSIAQQGEITPLPFAGSIRSKFLSLKANGDIPFDWYDTKKHSEFKEAIEIIGTPTTEGKIRFFGSYFLDPSGEELFSSPNDLVKSEFDKNRKLLLKPSTSDIFGTTDIYPVMPGPEGSFYIKEHEDEFITRSGLEKYLKGEIPNSDAFVSKSRVFFEERRVGIELDKNKKTTKEGMLYSIEYIRLSEGYSFSVWINDSYGLPTKGLLKIGGEGRSASYEIINNEKLTFSEIIQEVNKSRRFKLYLSTPAIFLGENNKSVCSPIPERLEEKLGVSVKLISMIPGKPIRLGGWDMAINKQKPLRYGVRSGAVYFYEIKEGEIDENIEMPLMLSDIDPWLGLGSGFIGRW
ncbi:MAG: type III-B CRISPR module-associated protein Cmr3 [Thermoplasmatales archaeon]